MQLFLSMLFVTGIVAMPPRPANRSMIVVPAAWLQMAKPVNTPPGFNHPQPYGFGGLGNSPSGARQSGLKKHVETSSCNNGQPHQQTPESPTWALGLLGLAAAGVAYKLKPRQN